jgi:hypothetical protein
MTLPIRLNKTQKRRFYREAVQETLTKLYGKPESVSKQLVSDWWRRISDTEEFKSDLFMHSEPLHTAADIARTQTIRITPENEEVYQNILQTCRNRVLHTKKRNQPALQFLKIPTMTQAAAARTRKGANSPKAKKIPHQKQLLAGH